jgi:hypothetical protein
MKVTELMKCTLKSSGLPLAVTTSEAQIYYHITSKPKKYLAMDSSQITETLLDLKLTTSTLYTFSARKLTNSQATTSESAPRTFGAGATGQHQH